MSCAVRWSLTNGWRRLGAFSLQRLSIVHVEEVEREPCRYLFGLRFSGSSRAGPGVGSGQAPIPGRLRIAFGWTSTHGCTIAGGARCGVTRGDLHPLKIIGTRRRCCSTRLPCTRKIRLMYKSMPEHNRHFLKAHIRNPSFCTGRKVCNLLIACNHCQCPRCTCH